jgi:hypothetical protein
MSHSTSLLDLMAIAQAGKEYAVNALADAASPASLYGRRASTIDGRNRWWRSWRHGRAHFHLIFSFWCFRNKSKTL